MSARKPYVDALRGFAVVLMVVNHTARWWLDPAAGPAREPLIYGTMALAGPTFLFLVGFSLALAYHGALERGEPFRAVVAGNLRRTILIAVIAVLLNVVVFPHDVLGARVLHSIALAIAAVTPLLPLVRFRAGRAALLTAAVGAHALFPLALPALAAWSAAHPVGAALLLREFPLFPWLAVVFLGLVSGWAEATGTRREGRWALAGLLAVAVYVSADWRTPLAARLAFGRDVELNGYWTAAPFTALGVAGAILTLAALAARVGDRAGWLVRLGQTALLLYVVHLVIVLPLGRQAWGLGSNGWGSYGVATVLLLVGLAGLSAAWLRLPHRPVRRPDARRLDSHVSHLVQGEGARQAEPRSFPGGRMREAGTTAMLGQRPRGRWPFLFTHRKEAIMADREAVIQRLSAANQEFRRLQQEHQAYESELSGLQSRPFLTTEQQWRVSELKKLKLMGKDRMEALIREQQRSAQTPA